MLSKLQSTRPFEVLNASSFRIATDEIESKFRGAWNDRPTAKRCHETVAMPFKRALAAGHAPKLVLDGEGRKGGDWYFVQLGPQVFPMRVRKRDWNPTELTIFEPVSIRDFDPRKVDKDGLGALYDKDLDKVDNITASREHAPTTHVRFKEGEMFADESYGWALWETGSALIRKTMGAKAAEAAAKPKKVFDPVLERDIEVALPDRYGKVARALLGSIGRNDAKASAGPIAAHELLAAFSYNGRPVAVTSQHPIVGADGKATSEPVKIWVQDRQPNGNLVWVDVPAPKDAKLPVRGVTAVLDGGTLHLFGGIGADGDTMKTHFTYDLGAALRDRHKPELWRQEAPLDEAVAWPAAVIGERETFLAGGVAGFYVKNAEDREKAKARALVNRRDLKVEGRYGWKKRDPFKTDVTGASAVFGKGCLFVGPGNQRSGRVFAYDTTKEGEGFELPSLPKKLGLGQLFLEGSKLLYAGGFDEAGQPSKAIFELDLEDLAPAWKNLGESIYAQGTSRLVESYGSVVALMIAPGKSAAFSLDGGLGAKRA